MVVPPLPHAIAWTLGVLGVAALARLIVKEYRRVNEELERVRASAAVERSEWNQHPTLRRDPRSGIWRPQ